MTLLDTIPGYREAVEQEQAAREAAFLLDEDRVAGVRVRPLTARHMLTLHSIRSPFVVGGEVRPNDVVLFLWVVSAEREGTTLEQYAARFRKRDYAGLVAGIRAFVESAFQDAPPVNGAPAITFWHWAAGLVDRFATAYHWREADVLDTPLARLFQYLKILDRRDDPRAVLFNPSDKVRSAWLRAQNEAAAN